MAHELTRVAESLENIPQSQLTREETLGVMSDAPTPGTQPGEAASATAKKLRVKWYRSPVGREDLARLNKRSDLLGFAQTLGYLAVLAASCSVTIYSFFHWPWYVTALQLSEPLHFGDYGGLPLKVLWALLDILTIVVLGSGLYLWLKRGATAEVRA